MIIWETEKLPESASKKNPCNPYYLVKTRKHGAVLAMYMNNKWYTSYMSKLVGKVIGWTEINPVVASVKSTLVKPVEGIVATPPDDRFLFKPHREQSEDVDPDEFEVLSAENTLVDVIKRTMIAPNYEILSIIVDQQVKLTDRYTGWNTHIVMVKTSITPPFPLGYTNKAIPDELIGNYHD